MELNKKNIVINKAIEILNKGGVILYPTDTIWGIGCDATNKSAIKKIYSIKKRNNRKPLILLMNNITTLSKYVKTIPKQAKEIIYNEACPVTIIYNDPVNLPSELNYHNTVGIRIVKEPNINQFLKIFNKPITSTSANISNNTTPISFEEISDEIKSQVDYIFPKNFININTNKSSKIIKINQNLSIEKIRD
ncbi:MAG: threonylcarbamoyl-AMP synthase [Flavobacteriales bacterium]|nr:threonylcarbamoyl-AMP synthase [Flavobacteriales bacterium]|tara:strand:- start:8775 stop:9350 length:576 start_codon:yes stop_codon:yes gene_type:complete